MIYRLFSCIQNGKVFHSGQSYKCSTIVNYDSRVVLWGIFKSDRRAFIRLATGLHQDLHQGKEILPTTAVGANHGQKCSTIVNYDDSVVRADYLTTRAL